MLDATKRLRRRLARQLHPDETVLAAVSVHREGTTTAALLGARAASTPGSAFKYDVPTSERNRWAESAGNAGPYLYLAVTSRRVVVVRRSVLGRARDIVFEAPLGQVRSLAMKPNNAGHVELELSDDRVLLFETPKAPKFLPEVYRRLPDLLAEAKGREALG